MHIRVSLQQQRQAHTWIRQCLMLPTGFVPQGVRCCWVMVLDCCGQSAWLQAHASGMLVDVRTHIQQQSNAASGASVSVLAQSTPWRFQVPQFQPQIVAQQLLQHA
jgi:hypothetical protein